MSFTITHLFILTLHSIIFPVNSDLQTYINVELSHGGTIRGIKETVNINGDELIVNRFLGIPYAMPPIGKLRFAPPEKHPGWNGVRNATKYSPTCWQYIFEGFDANNPAGKMWINNTEMSEDCLYLNVWVPNNAVNDRRLLPVMVWIYGGGFTSGSANLQVYNGAILSATQNVIIVSMQYRVGAFGFLRLDPNIANNDEMHRNKNASSNSSIALGNQGILDQHMALMWIKENIQRLHGDPNQVTIFGESAGAVSISILWMSPLAQSYFQRAILQSGSLYARWGLDNAQEAHEKAVEFALACGCKSPSLDRKASLECLQQLDPLTLINQLDSINSAIGKRRYNTIHQCLHPYTYKNETFLLGQSTSTRLYFDVPFQPVIDGYVIPKHPDEIFMEVNQKNALKLKPEILIGINENEALFFLLPGLSIKNTQFLYSNGTLHMPNSIKLAGNKQSLNGDDELTDFYWITTTQILDESHMRLGLAKLPSYYYNLPISSSSINGYYDPDTIKIPGEDVMKRLDELVGDLDFACPTINFAEHVARLPNAKVFLYHFNKRTQSLPLPKWTGVMHGYEIEYIFGIPYDKEFSKNFYNFTNNEKQLSLRIMQLWSNFAKTGHPSKTETGEILQPEWPLFRRTDRLITDDYDHFIIEDEFKRGSGLRRDRCKFWLHEMSDMAQILHNTCQLPSSGIKSTGYHHLINGFWLFLFIQYYLYEEIETMIKEKRIFVYLS
ncbi:hypothetical protein MN116_002594 [Schistosoma mekongi]|uniref:Carboxylesterase type B domain-containing protein n=1 Tax=Schistosoma mekongi TaxID=38744 RepID=A0AAE2D6Y9_SCHME|nr:hypothetical protein MN116_002594 [Schistosoma mekongi]